MQHNVILRNYEIFILRFQAWKKIEYKIIYFTGTANRGFRQSLLKYVESYEKNVFNWLHVIIKATWTMPFDSDPVLLLRTLINLFCDCSLRLLYFSAPPAALKRKLKKEFRIVSHHLHYLETQYCLFL